MRWREPFIPARLSCPNSSFDDMYSSSSAVSTWFASSSKKIFSYRHSIEGVKMSPFGKINR
jgi:hypothetical protein